MYKDTHISYSLFATCFVSDKSKEDEDSDDEEAEDGDEDLDDEDDVIDEETDQYMEKLEKVSFLDNILSSWDKLNYYYIHMCTLFC